MSVQTERVQRSRFKKKKCINCYTRFVEAEPVRNIVVSFLPEANSDSEPTDGDQKPAIQDSEVANITILDALLSIFSESGLVDLKKNANTVHQLSMCLRCSEILSNVYGSFIDLVRVSHPSAYICQLMPRIGEWHRRTSSKESRHGQLLTPDSFTALVDAALQLYAEPEPGVTQLKVNERNNIDVNTTSFSGIAATEEHENDYDNNTQTMDSWPSDHDTVVPLEVEQPVTRRSGRILNRQHNEDSHQTSRHPLKKSRTNSISEDSSEDESSDSDSFLSWDESSSEEEEVIPEEELDPTWNAPLWATAPKKPPSERKPRPEKRKIRRERVPCSVEGCPSTFLYHWYMHYHVQRDHENKEPLKCDKCNFSTFDSEMLKTHFCQKSDGKSVLCGYCNFSLSCSASLSQHSRTHDRNFLKCSFPDCTETFLRSSNLTWHEKLYHRTDPDEPTFQNGLPDPDVATLPPPLQCTYCGKIFDSSAMLKVHLEIHSSDRNYLCTQCGMTFKQKRALAHHNLVHNEDYRYPCALCPKKFKRRCNLRQHYRKTRVHPPEVTKKLLKGETLTEEDLKLATLHSEVKE